jgi:fructose-bisphosphate aldolase class I
MNCHGGKHLTQEQKLALSSCANYLASKGKGITACDESAGTIGKRFEDVGVENTEENRRAYREMLFTTPGVEKYLCGAILDPETYSQSTSSSSSSGELFPEVLRRRNIIPGVKPHLKVYCLPGTSGDTVMQGLDSLAVRLKGYYGQGARFTKWRSPLEVDEAEGRPTRLAIESNMRDLARFALISQAEGLVPLVEPDVVMAGSHSLETAIALNTEVASCLYREMLLAGVYMEGCILKTNMVCPGLSCPHAYTTSEIAEATLSVLRRTLPTAVPGVNFLSGGQSLDDAVGRLNAINQESTDRDPWNLSFSWSAAIQMPLLALCPKLLGGGKEELKDLTAGALKEMGSLYLSELKLAAMASEGKIPRDAKWVNKGDHNPLQ